ncbi:MAG: DUF2764 family protein [Spirochaetes bacterium]|jgi:hypothetical protein|nr:DUF2764 family protein [Spirochaetota bacterium]
MKLNYYIIASLPELSWEGDIRDTLEQYFEENGFMFEPFKDGIDKILLYNELRTLEMILQNNVAEEFAPSLITKEDAAAFLELPRLNRPEEYPEYIEEFFVKYPDSESRLSHFDELYLAYFTEMYDSKIPFFRYYADTALIVRTIIMAMRLDRKGELSEETLIGKEEIVSTILANKNSADYGLSSVFPEVTHLTALFEKDIMERDKAVDLFLLNLLSEYRADDIFGDHAIYVFIISLFFRDRWALLDGDIAESLVEEIING